MFLGLGMAVTGPAAVGNAQGGGMMIVAVNAGNTPVTLSNLQRAACDVSSTVVTVNAPSSAVNGWEIAVANTKGDASLNNITVSGNGANIENPDFPGTYAATVKITTLSGAYSWQYVASETHWKLV